MKNLTVGGLRAPGGFRGPRFQKFEKALYRTVVPTHTQNFSILAQLQSVQKSGERFDFWGCFRAPGGFRGPRFQKIEKASYRTMVQTHTQNFSTSAQLESVQKLGELLREEKRNDKN